MDSSRPATEGSAEPREVRLDSIAEQVRAIDALVDRAEHTLQVFDRDLAEGGWNVANRAERLTRFLRRSRNARLAIIVHDTRYLETACPRIVALLRTYGHAMAVWRTGAEARHATDALVIADGRHHLHRYHVDQPRATLSLDMPQATKPLVARFEEIWATGEPALGGSVLGL
jgi:hypothetical protein